MMVNTARTDPLEKPLLSVRDLSIEFATSGGSVRAVDGATFDLARGETLGLVGESGSGKSVTALAILGLLDQRRTRVGGTHLLFRGDDLFQLSPRARGRLRGRHMTMVMQNPLSSLDPLFTVSSQIQETVPAAERRQIAKRTGSSWRDHAVGLLKKVRIADPARRLDQYPHELSGGMRQRVASAIAITPHPDLVIADEPTTALDVTTQSQVLYMFNQLQAETGVSMIMITHDFAVVAKTCDRVAVMYSGRIVERGPTKDVLERPRHPYSRALLAAMPKLGVRGDLVSIPGQPPGPADRPTGCAFHPRCPIATSRCSEERPPEVEGAPGHWWACWNEKPE
jgi:oligopeptide transport system ATP-binding protein